jgi:hypothetical protein
MEGFYHKQDYHQSRTDLPNWSPYRRLLSPH